MSILFVEYLSGYRDDGAATRDGKAQLISIQICIVKIIVILSTSTWRISLLWKRS